MVNVDKYTRPMDSMGTVLLNDGIPNISCFIEKKTPTKLGRVVSSPKQNPINTP